MQSSQGGNMQQFGDPHDAVHLAELLAARSAAIGYSLAYRF